MIDFVVLMYGSVSRIGLGESLLDLSQKVDAGIGGGGGDFVFLPSFSNIF